MLKNTRQAGTLLVEALIALLLIGSTTCTIAMAITRSSRVGHDIRRQLEPDCNIPSCNDDGVAFSCVCGSRKWNVLK
jgi:hypothetical protein